MSIKDTVLKFLSRFVAPKDEPTPKIVHSLSRRQQRHEFIILRALEQDVFKVKKDGRIVLLDFSDWRYFKHELLNFCQHQQVWMSELEAGRVQIHCIGVQENLPRGIKFTWRFSKL